MKTTFDKFITDNPEQKALFVKEYANFVRSEMQLFDCQTRQTNSVVTKNMRLRREYA